MDEMTFLEYLEANDIPQRRAAEELEITYQYANNLARGVQTPGFALALKIARWSKGAVNVEVWEKKPRKRRRVA